MEHDVGECNQCLSKTIQPTNSWRNGGVELHEDKQYNADVRIDDAEEHGDGIERLIEDDAPLGGGAYFGKRRKSFQTLTSGAIVKGCHVYFLPSGLAPNTH